jgi:hypothetical protein
MSNAGAAPTAKQGAVVEIIYGDGVSSPSAVITDITVKESKSLASVDLLIGEGVHKTQWRKKDYALQAALDPSQLNYV